MSSPESVYYSPPSGYGVPDSVRDDQAEPCHLINLPNELLGHILSFLDPLDLAAVCQTCRTLNDHASADHIWQSIIQSHVPGNQVTSCYPCATFKELYVCHDPHWFLTKYKIWFCGRNLTGKLIVVRYDQRRGCIEGYQMLAVSNREHMLHTWPMDQEVVVHAFEPEVKLHLDKPALQLRAKTLENLVRRTISLSLSSSPGPSGSGSGSSSAERYHSGHSSNRYMAETPMLVTDNPDDTVFNNFLLARPLDDADAAKRSLIGFPYGNVWPPPDVPANHRVSSANFYTGEGMQLAPESRPATRAEVSDQAFHIRTWMEMRQTHPPGGINFIPIPTMTDLPHDAPNVHNQASAPWMRGFGPGPNTPGQPLHIGEEVNTYATLDPKLYTPTADKPWRGIWVGDYSGHGCEFLLVHQPDDDDDVEPFDESSMEQGSDETDEEFKRRKWEARVYRGKLEAIKLTGDPNVPRGECTFMAEDLGERGYVTTVKEEPFKGTRVVESMGHVAGTGFSNDKYIESQLLLISPDRLAQYWVGHGHISFFERLTEKLCAAETDALRGRGEAASDWVKIISTLHNSGSGAGPGAEAGITELATEAGSFADPG